MKGLGLFHLEKGRTTGNLNAVFSLLRGVWSLAAPDSRLRRTKTRQKANITINAIIIRYLKNNNLKRELSGSRTTPLEIRKPNWTRPWSSA